MEAEPERPQAIDRTPDAASTHGEGTSQDRCIVTRLRQTRANMIGTDDEQHYWDCHDAAAEIERLRLAIRRLAEQDATLSICEGNVTVTMDGPLTEAEREALEIAVEYVGSAYAVEHHARTLRGLLERTQKVTP